MRKRTRWLSVSAAMLTIPRQRQQNIGASVNDARVTGSWVNQQNMPADVLQLCMPLI